MSSLKNSFRHRLFAAMLLSSLLPLLICSVLMVQITRLRMENKAREDMAQQSAVLCQSLSEIQQAVTGAAARLTDTEAAIHALGSGVGSRLQTNSLLFDATDSWRNLAVFDLYDAAGVCRYSIEGFYAKHVTGKESIHKGCDKWGDCSEDCTDECSLITAIEKFIVMERATHSCNNIFRILVLLSDI